MLDGIGQLAKRSLTAVVVVLCVASNDTGQQPPALIRSGVVLVPLDVRVLDDNGEPITDLTVADFTVYEDGVRQDIAHFMTLSVSGGNGAGRPQEPGADAFVRTANAHRTFIVLLGRGRLNGPVDGLDALISFVRNLTPTDRVGVVAYLRASQPTTDHDAVIRFLERYRDQHEDLEGRLRADFRHHRFDAVTLSDDTRARLNAFFEVDGILTFRDLPGATGTTASRYLNLNYIRRTIQVASEFPGEKQLIVLTETPLGLSRSIAEEPDNHILVKLANEARVSLSYINTGGLPGQTMIRGQLFIAKAGGAARDASAMGVTDREFFAPGDHRTLAERTGGISTFYQYASSPLANIDRSTRFQYLLGYYPKRASSPDTYRTIRVVVSKPGSTARYRHGYRVAPAATDESDFRQAFGAEALHLALARLAGGAPRSRITTARLPAPALKIRSFNTQDRGGDALQVEISFDPDRVVFTRSGNRYRASLRLAVLVDDAYGLQVGELTRTVDLALSLGDYARTKKHWLAFDVTVPVQGVPARVRAAAYDYEADRTMMATAAIDGSRR